MNIIRILVDSDLDLELGLHLDFFELSLHKFIF